MRREDALQIGKATKRGYLGDASAQTLKTREITELCVNSGFNFHFIDAEWPTHYMTPNEFNDILCLGEELGSDLTTIVTINARHECAFQLTDEYVQVMERHENGGLCFVAGNPTYLTNEERDADVRSRIGDLVKTSRERLAGTPIFVGSEGLRDLTSELAESHSVIPFMLLGGHDGELNPGGTEAAVYCPCYLSFDDETKLIKALGPYALRRRWVRMALRERGLRVRDVKSQVSNGGAVDAKAANVLRQAIRKLALCDAQQAQETLRKYSSAGVRYAAVLLAKDNPEENACLSRLAAEIS